MIILNTTFYVETPLVGEFLLWLKDNYFPTSPLSNPSVARILTEIEPGFSSFAVRFEADDIASAEAWDNGEGSMLRSDLATRVGQQRILHFSTLMEEVAL